MNGQSLTETTHVTPGIPLDNPFGMNNKRATVTAPTTANVGCPSDHRHHLKDAMGSPLGGKDHTGSRAQMPRPSCPSRDGAPVGSKPALESSKDELGQGLNPRDVVTPSIAVTPGNRVGNWPRTVGISHHRIGANRS